MSRVPPLSERLQFARNTKTDRVHILPHVPGPDDPDWKEPPTVGFAEGLMRAAEAPVVTLCGQRLRIHMAGIASFDKSSPGEFEAGEHFTDDQLCIACVRALGDQQWRAFHVDNRGPE